MTFRSVFILISFIVIFFLVHYQLDNITLPQLIKSYWGFFFIGILAAIIANTTGAGGGIVFLPAFITLGLTPTQALATSFAIQCFGMSAGSIAWLKHTYTQPELAKNFGLVLLLSSLASIFGLLITQWCEIPSYIDIQKLFGIFSLIISILIFLKLSLLQASHSTRALNLTPLLLILITLIAFIGGIITAWLSIGVGEILAVLLIMVGFRVHFSIAIAVCVSAITVLFGTIFHIFESKNIAISILIFAAPGALLGGSISKYLATLINSKALKIIIAIWIFFSGLIYLVK